MKHDFSEAGPASGKKAPKLVAPLDRAILSQDAPKLVDPLDRAILSHWAPYTQ